MRLLATKPPEILHPDFLSVICIYASIKERRMPAKAIQTIHTLTDAATVNSAVGLLRARSHHVTCAWDLASLRKFSYLLLVGRVHVLPAMGPRRKPVGRYLEIVQQLPELEEFAYPHRRAIELRALQLLQQNEKHALKSWNAAVEIDDFFCWARCHKPIAFVDHSIRHRGLYSRSTIPLASRITVLTPKELLSLHNASKIITNVKSWSNQPLKNEVLIVTVCWMLDGMIRVIYYDLLAQAVGCEYVSHDFRSTLRPARKCAAINKSIQFVANLIAEQALAKSRSSERLTTYFSLVNEARSKRASNTLAFPEADGADAVKHALRAADELRIQLSSDAYERALEDATIKDLRELDQIADLRGRIRPVVSITRKELLLDLMKNFSASAAVLRLRQRGRPPLTLSDEYDTADLLHALIRKDFDDVIREDWTTKHAGRSGRVDFVIPSLNTIIEVKHVRDKDHVPRLLVELNDAFERYHHHLECKWLMAFIYDPQGHIADPVQLEKLSGPRKKGNHSFDVTVFVSR